MGGKKTPLGPKPTHRCSTAESLVHEHEGGNSNENKGQWRRKVLPVVRVRNGTGGGRRARRGGRGSSSSGRARLSSSRGGRGHGGVGDRGRRALGRSARRRLGVAGRGSLGGGGRRGSRGRAGAGGGTTLKFELGAVVDATRVLDLEGVGTSGKRLVGGPGEGAVRLAIGDDIDGLQVAAGAVLQGDGDGTGGTRPGDRKGHASGHRVFAVGQDGGIYERRGGNDDGSERKLHFGGLGGIESETEVLRLR